MKRVRMGMVGGGQNAFIGSVHRMAAALDGKIDSFTRNGYVKTLQILRRNV